MNYDYTRIAGSSSGYFPPNKGIPGALGYEPRVAQGARGRVVEITDEKAIRELDYLLSKFKGRACYDDPEQGMMIICNTPQEKYIVLVDKKGKFEKRNGRTFAVKLTAKETLDAVWWLKIRCPDLSKFNMKLGGESANKYIMLKAGGKDIYYNLSSGKCSTVQGGKKRQATDKEKSLIKSAVASANAEMKNKILDLIYQVMIGQ